MDKIAKALKKFSEAERKTVKEVLDLLKNNKLAGLNVVKLKGYHSIYRVRKGKIRIIYAVTSNNDVTVFAVERRTDNTYNHLDSYED